MKMTRHLPDDNNREQYPLFDGLIAYFPAALLEVSRWSKVGNDKHNPGEPLHWSREKSTDHENKIMRHLLDARQIDQNGFPEAVALAWRALALCQTILEEQGRPSGDNAKWEHEKSARQPAGDREATQSERGTIVAGGGSPPFCVQPEVAPPRYSSVEEQDALAKGRS